MSGRSVFDDPALTKRLRDALVKVMGESAVIDFRPVMGSEDFSCLG